MNETPISHLQKKNDSPRRQIHYKIPKFPFSVHFFPKVATVWEKEKKRIEKTRILPNFLSPKKHPKSSKE